MEHIAREHTTKLGERPYTVRGLTPVFDSEEEARRVRERTEGALYRIFQKYMPRD